MGLFYNYREYIIAGRVYPQPSVIFDRDLYLVHRGQFTTIGKSHNPDIDRYPGAPHQTNETGYQGDQPEHGFLERLMDTSLFQRFIACRAGVESTQDGGTPVFPGSVFDIMVDSWYTKGGRIPQLSEFDVRERVTLVLRVPPLTTFVCVTAEEEIRISEDGDETRVKSLANHELALLLNGNTIDLLLAECVAGPAHSVIPPIQKVTARGCLLELDYGDGNGNGEGENVPGYEEIIKFMAAVTESDTSVMAWYMGSVAILRRACHFEPTAFCLAQFLAACFRHNTAPLSTIQFNILAVVVTLCLSHDPAPFDTCQMSPRLLNRVAFKLVNMVTTCFKLESDSIRVYLILHIPTNTLAGRIEVNNTTVMQIWASEMFWENTFLHSLQMELLRVYAVVYPARLFLGRSHVHSDANDVTALQKQEEDTVYYQLGLCMASYIQCGGSFEAVSKFVSKMASLVSLTPSRGSILLNSIQGQVQFFLGLREKAMALKTSLAAFHSNISQGVQDNDPGNDSLDSRLFIDGEFVTRSYTNIIYLTWQYTGLRVALGAVCITNYRMLFTGHWQDGDATYPRDLHRSTPLSAIFSVTPVFLSVNIHPRAVGWAREGLTVRCEDFQTFCFAAVGAFNTDLGALRLALGHSERRVLRDSFFIFTRLVCVVVVLHHRRCSSSKKRSKY